MIHTKHFLNYIKDFGLAFIASLLVAVVTSFIVNPILANNLEMDEYGELLTLCGYVAIVSAAIGNSLNNVRLLDQNKDSGDVNNYNAILMMFSLIGIIIVLVLSRVYVGTSIIITVLLCFYVFLSTLNLYWIVSFRLTINYVTNLVYNCVVCFGYFLGLIIFFYTNCWPVVFVAGQLAGIIFLLIFTKLPFEGFRIDSAFLNVLKSFISLLGVTFIAQALSLLDRFVLYPLVGDVAVSQYNTAAFFGKGVGTVFGPIALVLLSYYVKEGFVITKRIFWEISFFGIIAVLLLFILSIPVAPIITKLLYPSIYEESQEYILVANMGSMLSALGVLLNPMVLKVCDIKMQPVIQFIHCLTYFVFGIVGTMMFGIMGFAFACIISNLLKVVLLLIIGGKHANY